MLFDSEGPQDARAGRRGVSGIVEETIVVREIQELREYPAPRNTSVKQAEHHQRICNRQSDHEWREQAKGAAKIKLPDIDPARSLALFHEKRCDQVTA